MADNRVRSSTQPTFSDDRVARLRATQSRASDVTRPLTMPVLAIGGEVNFGELVGGAVQAVADDVQGVVIPATGHFLAEESPGEMLEALVPFLASYRERSAHVVEHDIAASHG